MSDTAGYGGVATFGWQSGLENVAVPTVVGDQQNERGHIMSGVEKAGRGRLLARVRTHLFRKRESRVILYTGVAVVVARLTGQVFAGSFSTSQTAPTGAAISQPLFNQATYVGYTDYTDNEGGGAGEVFTPTTNLTVSSITFKGSGNGGLYYTGATPGFNGNFEFTLEPVTDPGAAYTDSASGSLIGTDVGNGNKSLYDTFYLSTPQTLTAGTPYIFDISTVGLNCYYGIAGTTSTTSNALSGSYAANLNGSGNVVEPQDPVTDVNANQGLYVDRTFFINGTPGPQIVYNAVSSNWVYNGNGAWETGTNWSQGEPKLATDTATFDNDGGFITVNPTVTLSTTVSLSSLTFNTAAVSYTINGSSGKITTNTINDLAGAHTINTEVVTTSGAAWTVNAGASLTVTNSIDGVGYYHNESVTGGGTLTINALANSALDVGDATTLTITGNSSGMYPYFHGGSIVNITSTGTLGLDQLFDDASETINIAAGGVMNADNFGSAGEFIQGIVAGAGAINVGANSSQPAGLQLNGNNANYSGPIYVNNGSQLRLGSQYSTGGQNTDSWGNDSATNTLTLDNGTLWIVPTINNGVATGFTGNHIIIINGGGGKIETNDAGDTSFNGQGATDGGAFTLGIGSVSGTGTLTVDGGGNLTVAAQVVGANSSGGIRTLALGGLNLINSSNMSLGSSTLPKNRTVLVVGGSGLSLSGSASAWTSTLDLGNNDLIVNGGSITTIANQIHQGYANGTWQGSGGILSTAAAADTTHLTALGDIPNTVDGSTPIYPTFDGVSISASSVLVKLTYYGDANLDGRVDGSDYSLIDNGFNQGLTGWLNGDFNGDGVVNGSDYSLVDNAYLSQGAAITSLFAVPDAVTTAQIAGSGATSAVPEPASLGLIGISALGLLARRKTRRHG